jgi:hypothetical protein
MKALEICILVLSGEWMLQSRSNGGLIIILRTFWVSVFMYAFAVIFAEISHPNSILEFSFQELRKRVSETVPWLGAIVGGVYVALYARFSSQWQYLAQLYNQLMEVGVTGRAEEIDKVRLTNWRAGFIEDAYCLHLACKPMFASAINAMLKDEKVLEAYRRSTIGADKHLTVMRKSFQKQGLSVFDL